MDAFSVDVGYINNPGSTTVTAYSASGAVLESSAIQQTGIVTVTVNQPGTASFTVAETSNEDAGFAVDNVSFLGYAGSPIGGNTTPNSVNAPTVTEQGSAPNPSEHTTTCGAADPVNCATGYFFETDVDAAVPGRGVPLAFARTYDSSANFTPGRLGWGWQDSYNMSLDIYDVPAEGGDLGGQAAGAGDAGAQAQGAKAGAAQLLDGAAAVGAEETQTQRTVWVNQENGSTVTFTRQGDGTYTAPSRVRATLAENADGSFTFTRRPSQQTWTFDRTGRLTQQGTVDGYKTTLTYDDAGRLSKVTDPAGRSLVFGYTDSVNNVGATVAGTVITSVTDPAGRVTKYSYDTDGNLAKVTDAAGGVWGYGYNASHLITSMTDPNGGVTTNVYDTRNRVVEQVSPAGQKTTWQYTGDPTTDAGATNQVWGPHGDVTTHVYKNMQLVRLTRATGTALEVSTSFNYDPTTLGMTSQTDALGRVTTHTYDARGNLTSTTDPAGQTVAFTYDANDRQTSTTSPLGAVTKSSYDAAGRLLSATDAAGAVTTYEHGDAAHPEDITKVTDATGHAVRHTYTATGEVLATTSDIPGGTATTTSGFDIVGQQICASTAVQTAAGHRCATSTTDATTTATSSSSTGSNTDPGTTRTRYDALGRVTDITDALGHVSSTTYDAVGNPLSTTAANGTKTTRTFDADNRLLTLTRGASGNAAGAGSPSTTSYGYDLPSGATVGPAGTVATAANTCPATSSWCNTTTDARGKTTITGVDLLGRVIATITPDGKSSTSRYDQAGNVVESTDEAGRATKNSYDAETGLLTAVAYSDPGTPAVSYAYDADARRTSMTDGTGTSTYTYDVTGRPVSITDGAGNVIKYGYDAIGRTTSLTYPNGQTITREYDNGGRLAAITDWAKRRTTFTYDADGDLTGTTYPNGVQVANGYDTLARLSSSTLTNAAGTTLAGIAQTRDASGLTTRETGTGATAGTLDYSYDAQNRLTSVNTTAAGAANGSATFGYDAVNNPTTLAGASQTFNDNGQLTTTTARTLAAAGTASATGASTTFGYDALGQRTVAWSTDASGAAAGTSYGYDQAGRLTTVSAAPTVTKLDVTAGPLAGGNTITVTGTHLSGTTAVRFAGLDATSFTVKSETTLSVTVPAGVQVGAVDVSVSTASGGTSLTSPASSYAYLEAPAITKVDANLGPLAGGTVTTLTGTHFTDVTAVTFGGKAATSFKVNSDTSITATVPATASTTTLTADVAVTSPTHGTNAVGGAARFTYLAAPVITSIDPASGPGVGGTVVTVTGTDFTGLQSVKVGGKGVSARYSPTTITFTVPAGRGSVDVVVTTIGGTSTTSTATKFTYTGVPTVTAIAPASGPGIGGTTVTVTGTNFTGATGVKFGTQDAASFTVISDTSIQANAPPGAGTVDVIVTTATGGPSTTSTADQFTYTGVPAVTKLSSQAGPLAGGATITLTGTNLTGATAVKFGTVAASNVKVVSDTSLTATVPASGTTATATVNVTVTTPTGGTSPTATANAYVYAAAPTITSISPTTAAAGDTVTITGTDFVGLSAIKFGTLGASGSYSTTSITTTVPTGGTGTVDLAITAAGGTSAATAASKFTFKTTAPSITAISPAAGPVAGGTSVTITGVNLTGATAVKFGTAAAKSFTVNSATSITAVTAAGTAGTVDITVTTPAGTTATSTASKFTFAAAPTVTKLSPSTGTTAGGTTVTITGTNLTGATAVKFGTLAASQVTVTSATTLTALAPAGAAGTVDVTVTTPGGTSATSTADKFTYTAPAPAITAITPAAGPVAGGTSVVITGTNLTGATAVKFGTVAAKSYTVNSATQITAVAAAGTAGTVDITVTTATGSSATSTADKFTFTAAPTVTKLSPTTGNTAGGTSVTLTGTNLTGATAVKFGTIAAKSFTVNSATSITAVTAAGTAGAVNVTVTTAGGTSATATANQFTYSKTATLSAPQSATGRALKAAAAVATTLPADTIAAYSYNGAGLRVAKTTATGTASFVYDTTSTVPQLLTDGATSYLYGPDGAALAQISASGEINYYFHDQRGSTRALINAAGATSATYTYNAYGALTAISGTANTPLRFTGAYTDTETGFVYLINRYYDPATAQFISVDPAVVATLQAYAYVNADPINGVDPLGLFGWDTVSSLAAGFGDTVTFGGTKQIRRLINYALNGDTNDFDTVSPCSLAYKVGNGLGFAAGLVTGETELQLLNAAREANSAARVGRWMSEIEHEAMLRTGMVQEGAGGTTFVASPADVMSYLKQAAAGTRYVEFDVPAQSLRAAGKEGWAQIAGPNSLAGRLAAKRGEPLPSFPMAKNIEWVASKIR